MKLRLTLDPLLPYHGYLMRRTLTASIAALLGSATLLAWAQTASAPVAAPSPMGAVTEVKGLVTISLGTQLTTVEQGTPIYDGARFVAGSSGAAEMKLSNGCVIRLEANQMVIIDSSYDCPRQLAAITNVAENIAAAAPGINPIWPLLGAAALAGAVARREREVTPQPQ